MHAGMMPTCRPVGQAPSGPGRMSSALQRAMGLLFIRYFLVCGPLGHGHGAARRSSRPVARIAGRDHPGHFAWEPQKNFLPQKVPFRGVGASSGSVGRRASLAGPDVDPLGQAPSGPGRMSTPPPGLPRWASSWRKAYCLRPALRAYFGGKLCH